MMLTASGDEHLSSCGAAGDDLDRDEARAHYFHQQNAKHQLHTQLTLPVAVLTALVSALAVLLRSATPTVWSLWPGLTIMMLCTVSGLACLVAFVFLVKSLAPLRYQEFGDLRKWIEHREALKSYGEANPAELADADSTYDADLLAQYATVSDAVQNENIRRSFALYWARAFLTIAAVSLAIATIPYAFL